MAYHVTDQPGPRWTNARALCNAFCNATNNQARLCPASCLPECPAICQYVLIPPTTTAASTAASARDDPSTIYTLDPFFIATFASLAIGFLAMCCYAVYLKYYSKRGRSEHEAEVIVQVRCEPDRFGFPGSVIGSMGIHNYRKGDDALFKEMECAVCLNEFQDCEMLRILPKCRHAFHMSCVDVWLGSHLSCPICRACTASVIATAPVTS